MVFGIKDRTLEEILKTLDRIVQNPDDLEHWTMSIETAAKDMAIIRGTRSISSIILTREL